MSNYSLPKTAVRFTVPQYCEWDPVELAVDIRDDYHGQTVPGGCINVCACETCGDREGGCPYCDPSAGWAK